MKANQSAINEFTKGLEVFEGFHWGRGADVVRKVVVPSPPDVLVFLGILKTVAYQTRKLGREGDNGAEVIYVHSFDNPFPMLCTSQNRSGLWIVGGDYKIKDAGITG